VTRYLYPAITDDDGNPLTDDADNPIVVDKLVGRCSLTVVAPTVTLTATGPTLTLALSEDT
jgi:hypothetical protein